MLGLFFQNLPKGVCPSLLSTTMQLRANLVLGYGKREQTDIAFKMATTADGKAYAEIINQCFGDSVDDKAIAQLLRDPSVQVYLLEREGKVIGTTTVQLRANLVLGYIYDVAIVEEHRGQGLGSLMLKQCINKLKADNMKKASLLVTGENKSALALYHRLGFREADEDILMTTR